ncbi:MAG TPA: serine hydrolase [Kofleriaceae bacterium]|nr:serine hydrolase [Kofleriaceae bacterium]
MPWIALAAVLAALLGGACTGVIDGGQGGGGGPGGGAAGEPDAGGGSPGQDGGAPGADAGIDPAELAAAMQETLDRLLAEAAWRSPGTAAALSVVHLSTGARASARGDELYVSASSAKAWWVAAALDGVGVAPVEPHADPIFVDSDNGATGAVIDLIGPDAVNVYLWDVVGMERTALTRWNYQAIREASNSPRLMGTDNYTTANDSVLFLSRLQAGEVLGAEETAALLDWMTRAPREGFGGWLGTRLPEAARAGMRHKAGWLPPGCCSDQDRYNTLNDVGLIDTPAGTYAVAILLHAGDDWYGRQVPYAEYASCEIYKVVAGDAALDCAREGDPAPP